jgi:hypothetical protein
MNKTKGTSKRSVAKHLRQAANLIVNKGFCKGIYTDGKGFCALGALYQYGQNNRAPTPLIDAAQEALSRVIGFGYIPSWNDAPGRTKAEVVGALRKTARLLEHGMAL